MSESTRKMCEEHARGLRESLEELWAAVDAGELYEDSEPLEYLDEWPLEIVWERGTPFAVVFGTGGPHVEILHDLREGGPRIAVYWSGERAYAHGDAVDRTADYFREQMEEIYGE